MQTLQESVETIYRELPNSIVIVIGGTDDMSLALASGTGAHVGKKELNIVRLDSALDVRPAYSKQAFKDAPVVEH